MSWINWYYGVSDENWLLRRIFEEEHIINETWRRQHTSKEEAENIPPDYDELFDDSGGLILRTEYEQEVIDILKHAKQKKIREERSIKSKQRIPIPKKVKVQLIRERGGLCERCKENIYHHLHHLDGNPSNNNPSNLLLVCYDCHLEITKK